MLNRNALILVLTFWSFAAAAQVPVVEAGGRRGQQEQPAQAEGGNQLLMTLYTQLEALQQEVQNLRGMVEEQANQLRRMQTEQRDRYLDVDRRLSELSGGAATMPGAQGATTLPGAPGAVAPSASPPGVSPAGTQPAAAVAGGQFPPSVRNDNANTTPPAVSLGNSPPPAANTPAPAAEAGAQPNGSQLGEQDLYRTALNLLLEQNKYEESIRLFQEYIDRFPQGRLVTNAYYWQGEALILVPRLDQARDVFLRIINSYPEDPKAAAAMVKLGVVYQQMGDRERAEQTWRDIATRYPENLTEIRTAQGFLDRP